MKFVIILALLAIFACMGSALFFMLRQKRDENDEQPGSSPMFRALALRVAVSVVLFICILVAAKLGYIQPHGLIIAR